jgi:hypothetical protein
MNGTVLPNQVFVLLPCLLLTVSAMGDDMLLGTKTVKKTSKRGVSGLGFGGFGSGVSAFGFGGASNIGFNAAPSFPAYFEQPALFSPPTPAFSNQAGLSAALAARTYFAKQQAQTLANRAAANAEEVAAAIAAAKEATAAAAAARENVQAAKDAVVAQQRIAAAKEAAAAAAIQRSEAAVNAAAAIEKSEAAAAAAAAIQQSAIAAKAAVSSAHAAKAAASSLAYAPAGAQYIPAKKATEYGPWG